MNRYEITFLPGLQESVLTELTALTARNQLVIESVDSEFLVVTTSKGAESLCRLRTVSAVFLLLDFSVPRPKALLGEENFSRLQAAVRSLCTSSAFLSFRVDAAGNNSSVMTRLRAMIAERCNLADLPDSGELQIRIKRSATGWRVLLRTTPAPLSARAWRVQDMPGAVNACIAAAMVQMLSATSGVLCNVCCGSGSLLIESDLVGRSFQRIGIDLSREAIAAASANLAAATSSASLVVGRAEQLPLPDASCSAILADLPWGERIGNRADNLRLYHRFFSEASRTLRPGGELLVLTQDIGSLNHSLEHAPYLTELQRRKVFQKGFWPTIVHLTRC